MTSSPCTLAMGCGNPAVILSADVGSHTTIRVGFGNWGLGGIKASVSGSPG